MTSLPLARVKSADWVLMILGTGFYFLFTGEVIGQTETTQMQVGMYVAMLAVIVFIGRREYASILRHAFTLRKPQDKVLGEAVVAQDEVARQPLDHGQRVGQQVAIWLMIRACQSISRIRESTAFTKHGPTDRR